MTETLIPCSACREPMDAAARFCPHCGAMQSRPEAAAKTARTMLGMSSEEVLKAAAQLREAQAPSNHDAMAKTMIGQALSVPSPPTPAEVAPTPTAPAASPVDHSDAVSDRVEPETSAEESSVKQAQLARGRTMLGVPDPGALVASLQKAAPPAHKGGTEVDSPALQDAATAAQASKGGTAIDSPALQDAAAAAQRASSSPPASDGPRLRLSESMAAPPRRSRTPWIVAIVLIVVVFVVGFYLLQNRASEGVEVTVINGDKGEMMQFRIADAVAGSKLDFGGQTRNVEDHVVQFPLANDSLELGDNLVVAELIQADGTREELRVPLHVDYRVHLDTSSMDGEPPTVAVMVSAPPGTHVQLDGQDLTLDAQGQGIRRDPALGAALDSGSTWEHRVQYQLDFPQGDPAQVKGELRASLPMTSLRLDSPGPAAIVDSETIDIIGTVEPGTAVTLDDKPVDVADDGHFSHALTLPSMGRHESRLTARAKGRVPVATTLEITRVEDLAKAALAFAPSKALSYEDAAANAESLKGQRVDFTGRVFNVNVEAGRGVLQMLVRDCEKGKQCSLWVTYTSTHPVEKGRWVRVLGTLEGNQQFRSQSDFVVTVPKVQAVFVLPVKS